MNNNTVVTTKGRVRLVFEKTNEPRIKRYDEAILYQKVFSLTLRLAHMGGRDTPPLMTSRLHEIRDNRQITENRRAR